MGSKLEQEVKFFIGDLGVLEERLIALGAQLKQTRVLEVNMRFDTPDRRLSHSFQALRLRHDEVDRLTWKGAGNITGEVRAREEFEVEVSDIDTARAILEALGFEVMMVYEKYRAAYNFEKVEISLDEMPFGNFCEIEGPDTLSIQKAAALLGLPWEASSKLSYLEIFGRVKENLRLAFRDLTFDNFKGSRLTPSDLGLTKI